MAVKTWIATTSSTWATVASWSPSGVPASTDDVVFNNTYNGDCSIGATATCRSLKMNTYSGIFSGTAALNITGNDSTSSATYPDSLNISGSCNFTYSGTITFTTVNWNLVSSAASIYCNGKTLNGPIVFNGSTLYDYHFWDVFRSTSSLTLTAGILSAEAEVYVGSISLSNSNLRQIQFQNNLYLTGSSTLITATTTTNLTWGSNSIIVTGNQSVARTLTFNTVVYPGNGYVELGGTGSGGITLAPGTTGDPRVAVTNTGGATVSFSTGNIAELIFSGGTNVVWSNAAGQTLTIDGDLTLVSTMGTPTLTPSFVFKGLGYALAYNSRITLAGKSLVTGFVTLNDTLGSGAGLGTFTFVDAFTHASNGVTITSGVVNINANFTIVPTNSTFTFTAGTLNVNNGANITTGLFASSVANARILNMGSGTWTISGTGSSWNMNGTSITLNAQTSRIVFTNTTATAITFVGGGLTYYTVEYARGGGGGTLTFTLSNVIANFIDVNSTAAHSILFTATTSFYRFIVKGSPGQLITVGRSATGAPVMTKVGRGIVCNCDYLNIVSLGFSASPTNTWYAGANSTGSATGWIMTAPPSSQSLLGAGGVG